MTQLTLPNTFHLLLMEPPEKMPIGATRHVPKVSSPLLSSPLFSCPVLSFPFFSSSSPLSASFILLLLFSLSFGGSAAAVKLRQKSPPSYVPFHQKSLNQLPSINLPPNLPLLRCGRPRPGTISLLVLPHPRPQFALVDLFNIRILLRSNSEQHGNPVLPAFLLPLQVPTKRRSTNAASPTSWLLALRSTFLDTLLPLQPGA